MATHYGFQELVGVLFAPMIGFYFPINMGELKLVIDRFSDLLFRVPVLRKPHMRKSIMVWEAITYEMEVPTELGGEASSMNGWPALSGKSSMTQLELIVMLLNSMNVRMLEIVMPTA